MSPQVIGWSGRHGESCKSYDEVHVATSNIPDSPNPRNPNSPGTWPLFRKGVRRILAPVERFLAIEAASGVVLMIAATAALAWANSASRIAYFEVWHFLVGFRLGGFAFERDLHFWINEGLMTIFFFVVGLEIRREIHHGELSEIRRATLPLAAALGGMLVPALIYILFNDGRPSAAGWGIPMATDISFAVGVFTLLGKRVPPALRILLLTLAVIDDVGAIIVIALFYSVDVSLVGFGVLVLGVAAIFAMQLIGIRSPVAYIFSGIAIWIGAYVGGIHPTLAGVILGLITPVRGWDGAERLEHVLHRWVAFGIMPLFAFANAGVPIQDMSLGGDATWVFWGVMLGLTVGKPVGILSVSWLAARSGLAALPASVRWSQISVVGILGGIGFTMALFIAQLALPPGPLLETAKLAILCGSGLAGVFALVVGYLFVAPDNGGSY